MEQTRFNAEANDDNKEVKRMKEIQEIQHMADHPQQSPETAFPAIIAEAEYVSRLSTILVETIEETKERISQIEYIFCSQLFPNFQSNSKRLRLIYSEGRNAAETS
ncbi:hypothetical protein RND71_001522 [Anisodus tanguticus]|uniref:Uncharacterized protein n=1 Tax=Anisodus tanguticus TaxID=243964 RepID=A0AAE1VYI7_9SOLA|nr:hypothetical protein RND71_001522 [Anisodus tanguticus]